MYADFIRLSSIDLSTGSGRASGLQLSSIVVGCEVSVKSRRKELKKKLDRWHEIKFKF